MSRHHDYIPRTSSKNIVFSRPVSSVPHGRWAPEFPPEFQLGVDRFIQLQRAQFVISGTFPTPPEPLTLFFKANNIAHCLDFAERFDQKEKKQRPPAFEALLRACHPSSVGIYEVGKAPEYPPSLIFPHSFATSLDLSNHPVLEIIRTVLLPNAQAGHYLIATRSHLEIHPPSGYTRPQRGQSSPSKVATLILTLPVSYKGGALVVHSSDGRHREGFGMNGPPEEDMEWTAFAPECEYEIQNVDDGFRMAIFYDVFMKSYGPCGIGPDAPPNPLITPSEHYLDTLSQILNGAKGRWIGFFLTGEYTTSPSDVIADSLVPVLKGSDSMLYHALKLYFLAPELRYTAGGFIWPVDKTAQVSITKEDARHGHHHSPRNSGHRSQSRHARHDRSRKHYHRGPAYGSDSDSGHSYSNDEGDDSLAGQVLASGALPLAQTGIQLLTAPGQGTITRQKIPFIDKEQGIVLDVLYVNICMVLFVA